MNLSSQFIASGEMLGTQAQVDFTKFVEGEMIGSIPSIGGMSSATSGVSGGESGKVTINYANPYTLYIIGGIVAIIALGLLLKKKA